MNYTAKRKQQEILRVMRNEEIKRGLIRCPMYFLTSDKQPKKKNEQ